MPFLCDDVEDIKAYRRQTRHTVDSGICKSFLKSNISVDGNPEKLGNLNFTVTQSFSFFFEAVANFLSLFCAREGHTKR